MFSKLEKSSANGWDDRFLYLLRFSLVGEMPLCTYFHVSQHNTCFNRLPDGASLAYTTINFYLDLKILVSIVINLSTGHISPFGVTNSCINTTSALPVVADQLSLLASINYIPRCRTALNCYRKRNQRTLWRIWNECSSKVFVLDKTSFWNVIFLELMRWIINLKCHIARQNSDDTRNILPLPCKLRPRTKISNIYEYYIRIPVLVLFEM